MSHQPTWLELVLVLSLVVSNCTGNNSHSEIPFLHMAPPGICSSIVGRAHAGPLGRLRIGTFLGSFLPTFLLEGQQACLTAQLALLCPGCSCLCSSAAAGSLSIVLLSCLLRWSLVLDSAKLSVCSLRLSSSVL